MKRTIKVKEKRGFWCWFWLVSKWITTLGVICSAAVILFGLYKFSSYAAETPPLDPAKLVNPMPSRVYDRDGGLVTEFGAEPRIEIDVDEAPVQLIDALTSIEDTRFWYHKGVDPIRILKSAVNNVLGGRQQGGSTITQQLVKLSFLDPNEKSLARKTKESVLSWKMEDMYSKGEILQYYINKVYMGDGVYGFETAAKHYYGTTLNELSIDKIAYLAGIPNSPEGLNPTYGNLEVAKERRDSVLRRMYELKKITKEEYDEAVAKDIKDGIVGEGGVAVYKKIDPEYMEYMNMVFDELEKLQVDTTKTPVNIYTYLDTEAQKNLNSLVYKGGYTNLAGRNLEVYTAAVDNYTGGVRALAGGNENTNVVYRGFSGAGQGTLAYGSTLKPVLYWDYMLSTGKNMASNVYDSGSYRYANGFQVKNFDGIAMGNITLGKALETSRNTIALETQQALTTDGLINFANRVGFTFGDEARVESWVLSSYGSAVELATAYSNIGSYGLTNKTAYVKKVEVIDTGEVLYEQPKGEQIGNQNTLKDLLRTMYKITYAEDGYGHEASFNNNFIINSKTGTTNYGAEEGMPYNAVPEAILASTTAGEGGVGVSVIVRGTSRTRGLSYDEGTVQIAARMTPYVYEAVGSAKGDNVNN